MTEGDKPCTMKLQLRMEILNTSSIVRTLRDFKIVVLLEKERFETCVYYHIHDAIGTPKPKFQRLHIVNAPPSEIIGYDIFCNVKLPRTNYSKILLVASNHHNRKVKKMITSRRKQKKA